MQIFTKINLDLLRPAVQVIVNAKQNDKAARFVQAYLWEGGQPFAPGSVLATFRVLKPDGTAAFYDTNENGDPAVTISGNVATIELVEQVLTVPGDVAAELNLYTADGEKLTSFTFTIRVQASVLNDAEIVSSDYFNVLTDTFAQAQAAADRAEAAADRVEDLTGELVKSVNGQTPDENGNVNVQAGVTYLPNLLDNTDFSNPVNQKGETSYSGSGYGIDRWTGMSRTVVELVSGGVQLSNNNPTAGFAYWQQLIEPERLDYSNQPYSVGVKINGTLYCASGTGSLTATTNENISLLFQSVSSGHLAFRITLPSGYTGQIVVSEPALYPGTFIEENFPKFYRPDYAEELAKCQRYFVRIKNEGATTGFIGTGVATSTNGTVCVLPLPVSMRAAPALSGWSGVTFGNGNSNAATAATSVEELAAAAPYNTRPVVIRGTSTKGDAYVIYLTDGGYLDFDANL